MPPEDTQIHETIKVTNYTTLFLNQILNGIHVPRKGVEEDKNKIGLKRCDGCEKFFIQLTKREKFFHSRECLNRFTAKKSREDAKIRELSSKGLSNVEIAEQTGFKKSRIEEIISGDQ